MQRLSNSGSRGSARSLPDLVERTTPYETLVDNLVHNTEQCLYLYGPKGLGKTLLTHHALRAVPERTTVCFLSGITNNTQYKVLNALYRALTGDELASGYHTAQLTNGIVEALPDNDVVLVLDDVDFLLLNDGTDLLYFLSRLDQQGRLRLVMVSANHPDLTTRIDERVYSSLHPYTLHLDPYTEEAATRVLNARVDDWLTQPVTMDALASISAMTSNIQLGYHWLTVAEEIVDGEITETDVQLVQSDAHQRYQQERLTPFTEHHTLLLNAIELLAADTDPLRSGAIYDVYRDLCKQKGIEPRCTRRLSDYLKHLDLLSLTRTEYQYGGRAGKTRHIWLEEF